MKAMMNDINPALRMRRPVQVGEFIGNTAAALSQTDYD